MSTDQPPPVRAGRHARPDTSVSADPAAQENGGELLVDQVDHRERFTFDWRNLPRPSLAALLGVAVLLLIAGGAVHLSSRGTALDAPAAPDLGHAAEEAGELHPGDAAPTGGAGADGQPQEEQPQGELSGDGQGAAADEAGGVLIVHVTGAVATPGVVEIPPGARVHDAVEAAGGATGDADLAAVNLARAAVDGEQVHVPVPGEEPRDTPAGPPADGAEGADSDAAAPGRDEGDSAGGAVNLNTAGESELQELPGVGPAIAGRILEHREANGPFRSVDDLLEVSGIGPATLEKIREKATV